MERIGILLVHGVGEQQSFQHLEGEIRQIVQAIEHDPDVAKVSVTTRTSLDSAYLAEQTTWKAEDGAPVQAHIVMTSGERKIVDFREVWWADIDERNTLWSQVRFWFWGLAQWAVAGYETNAKSITDFVKLKLPMPPSGIRPKSEWIKIKLKLFFVAWFFSITLLTLELINFVLSRLLKGRIPGSGILVSYVGDVKLMLQDEREGSGPIYDLGQPPRATVRRRMVRGLVDMALDDYDRWYVAAHSLGTVVSFNGLMETQLALPNYLSEEKWRKCKAFEYKDASGAVMGNLGESDPNDSAAGKKMMPTRPVWLQDNDVIRREFLFGRLQGYLTYGSPLDKFSALWSGVVGINQNKVMPPDFEWINVYDETDPVAGPLNDYGTPTSHIDPPPRNFAFNAGPVLLLSHLQYLSFKNDDDGRLVNRLATWSIHGGNFPAPAPDSSAWREGNSRFGRAASRYVQWFIAFVGLATLLGWVFGKLSAGYLDIFDNPNATLFEWTLVGLGVTFVMVAVTGILRLLRVHRLGG